MAQQIKKKFIGADQIDGSKILLEADQTLRKKDGAGGEIDVVQNLKDYTDQQIADLVNSAPEVLDTLKELSDALGGDPNFATTISNQIGGLDSRVDTLESEMDQAQADITSLDLRVDALEAFGYGQIVHVAKNGLDTNSGKQHAPFLTISAALNSITDASPSKRYVVLVAAGNYTESSGLALKPNVYVVGENMYAVRITGAVSMHSSFTGSDDHRSGFANVTLLSAADFNWSTVTSAAGKIYCRDVQFGSTTNLYGHNNAIAQAQFANCLFFGNLTISGINVGVFQNNVCFANITLNQHPNGGMATILAATGGYCSGTITQNASVNDFNRRSASFLRHFNSEQLVLNGPAVYADVDLVSQGKQLPTISNNANLVALTPRINHDMTTQMIVPKATNSHNMGDWGKQWTWNFGYVHASTGTDLYLISYPESYAPDSAGKSIGIYTDGAGLQNNVNGGSIELATATTSGTGIRGKITLDGREIDVTSKQIKNVADGSAASDAVNKSQLDAVAAQIPQFDKNMVEVGAELAYVDLDREYSKILSASLDRMAIHEDVDYTLSVVGGVTRMTFINSLVNPTGAEKVEIGDKIFYSGIFY